MMFSHVLHGNTIHVMVCGILVLYKQFQAYSEGTFS